MEQWTHPLEPLTSKELPTPATLDTLSLESTLKLVGLMECGALVNLPVNVSVTYTALILLIAPLQSLSCPLEALSTILTTQLCPSPSLERAPLPSPVTPSYLPAAEEWTTPMEWLSEVGEDQMGPVYLQRLTLEQQLRDSTSPEMSPLSA